MECATRVYQRVKDAVFSRTEETAPGASCCCGGAAIGKCNKYNSPQDAEAEQRIHVNPYAPIREDALKVTCSNTSGSSRRNKGGNSKFIRLKQVLRFGSRDPIDSPGVASLSFDLPDLSSKNVPRYKREFHEVELLGKGVFGTVYRCVNLLDGCEYAIKRSKALRNSKFCQRRAMNELYANAALKTAQVNMVRYYSAWVEDDCLSLQLEYCNGGDLANRIEELGGSFDEDELEKILYHVAEGLRWIHDAGLAHNDLKPENIFIKETYTEKCGKEVTYKIGDFGHLSSTENAEDLDEGDCRYMSREIMCEDYTNLFKADIFALGLTIFEAGGGGPLPKNGSKWQDFRDGNLDKLPRYSDSLNEIMALMVHPDPEQRPSAFKLVNRRYTNIKNLILQ